MEPIEDTNLGLELELQIEELEDRIAPDGGETVLPLIGGKHHHK
jgi:hypothetical protein